MHDVSRDDLSSQLYIRQSLVHPQGGLITLEQLHQTKCTTPLRPWLVGTHEALHQVVFFQPNCKLWSCPHCAEINRRKWTYRAAHGVQVLIDQGQSVVHITLTSHEKLDAEQTVRVLPFAWKKLRMRMSRASDVYDYYLVPERHEDSRLHVHMLTSAPLPERWWKDNARQSGMGYQAKEREVVDPVKAGYYVSKYLSKSIAETRWKSGFRRVRTSRSWPKLPDIDKPVGWEFLLLDKDLSLADFASHLQNLGYMVSFASSPTGWAIINTVGQGA